jgi:hypothetical protein
MILNQKGGGSARQVLPFTPEKTPHKVRSLREYLKNQGVTSEESMRAHLNLITEMVPLGVDPFKYRVNPDSPNSKIPMMG